MKSESEFVKFAQQFGELEGYGLQNGSGWLLYKELDGVFKSLQVFLVAGHPVWITPEGIISHNPGTGDSSPMSLSLSLEQAAQLYANQSPPQWCHSAVVVVLRKVPMQSESEFVKFAQQFGELEGYELQNGSGLLLYKELDGVFKSFQVFLVAGLPDWIAPEGIGRLFL
ncbi:MAG: hypothetical protein M1816_005757 [Peltula sp. TS41687]|nr:MAG: hypothetical protein M1816_005757 [Peltula sp. TS41687]